MKNDALDGLVALKLVADKLNFTAAAQVLGISPSGISQTIKQLEERLGVTLLTRTTRSTHLTEAGERFLKDAGPALDQIIAAMENVNTYSKKPSGLLRINLSRSIYPALVAPLISSFYRKYPDITVDLFFDDDLSDVVERGFDAGIRLSEMMAKDMVALRLTKPQRFVVVGTPKYFNRAGRPKHPKDLLNHNCIRMRVGPNELYDRWEFESKGKDFQVEVSGQLILNDSNLVRTAVLEGEGVTYLAEDMIRDQIKGGKLEVVLSQFAAVSDGFYLYYPKRSQVMPKLRAFIDHVVSEIAEAK